VIKRGGKLYTVDEQPVVLLFGKLPAWRTLKRGVSDGRDVRQLERNLKALGFDDGEAMAVDGHFDAHTTQAVVDWQSSLGANDDGAVDLGEIVFLPGAVRIDEQLVALGSSLSTGAQVFEVGPTTPAVSVSLTSDQLDLVSVGSKVQLELSDGTSTPGTVTTIGAAVSSEGSGGGDASSSTTVPVTIALDRPKAAKGLTGAAVTVNVVTDQRTDAVAVPVTALLALQSGGYAVQVDRGAGRIQLVRVSPGLFDDGQGLVEVTSGGLQPGDRVVVASS
jgi:peptidoglycan hydrolase-like protein with peptidoglycan-binding domain